MAKSDISADLLAQVGIRLHVLSQLLSRMLLSILLSSSASYIWGLKLESAAKGSSSSEQITNKKCAMFMSLMEVFLKH